MISILGMHRSGTSALANALHKLGADLGPASSWIQPAADNPRGFFEYAPVVNLNRDLFAALGGTWSSPPAMPADWVHDTRVLELHDQAEQLTTEIGERMVVKDPRLSLLQPFWETVTKVPQSMLCLRHPAAVADSLLARNKFSIDQGLFLWFRYNAAATLNRPDALIVEYESLLADPVLQLNRVAEHICLEVSATTVKTAAGTVSRRMAHAETTELPDMPIGIACRRLYDLLRSGEALETDQTIWIWAHLVTELPWAGPADRDISRTRHEVTELNRKIDRLTEENERRERRLERLETELRQTLTAFDVLSISENADLLRSLESDQS